jgi:hypothetical protein
MVYPLKIRKEPWPGHIERFLVTIKIKRELNVLEKLTLV